MNTYRVYTAKGSTNGGLTLRDARWAFTTFTDGPGRITKVVRETTVKERS